MKTLNNLFYIIAIPTFIITLFRLLGFTSATLNTLALIGLTSMTVLVIIEGILRYKQKKQIDKLMDNQEE